MWCARLIFMFGMIALAVTASAEITGHAAPLHVSMVWLINDPSEFANKDIVVDGYISLEKEDAALYLDCTSYLYLTQVNSVNVVLDTENYLRFQPAQGSYVQIVGIFKPNPDYKKQILRGAPAGKIIVDTYKALAAIQPLHPRGTLNSENMCSRH